MFSSKRLIIVNSVLGKKRTRAIDILRRSVQGQEAVGAWKAASHILKSMHIPGEVVFVWYENEKAVHPNQTGKLSIK